MRAICITKDGTGRSRLESLRLPFMYVGPAATEQDRAWMPPSALASAVHGVAAMTMRARQSERWSGDRHLSFVTDGAIDVESNGMRSRLGPGDVIFVDGPLDPDHEATALVDTKLLRMFVDASWNPFGSVPPIIEADERDQSAAKYTEMYVHDDVANFRPFNRLFGEHAATEQSITAVKFIAFSPGTSGGWHTDENINLVCVGSGVLELEVGGEQAVERFYPGDVCLVQDQHGQGHILRAHGETRILAITLPNVHRWNSA